MAPSLTLQYPRSALPSRQVLAVEEIIFFAAASGGQCEQDAERDRQRCVRTKILQRARDRCEPMVEMYWQCRVKRGQRRAGD